MNRRDFLAAGFLAAVSAGISRSAFAAEPPPAKHEKGVPKEVRVVKTLDIAKVPSSFPVGFCLLTRDKQQYVAYYDADRRMTVASRTLDSDKWLYKVLPSSVGWDSHNSITMVVDDDGIVHLSGNMHANPLVYFRTARPRDIASFERIPSMTGENEGRCTYPNFMRDADGRLIFHYRDGGSGNGNEIYNVYNPKTRTWRRLLDKPLTDGRGKMNAYMVGPKRGPDGWFHLGWVWRNSPDCRTNHDPSYARSRDLVHWETISGKAITLPITMDTAGTLIDHIPPNGGIINGALNIGFDSEKRTLATYHKFDKEGNTQAYVARFENGKWIPRQITKWQYRWAFEGGGSIGFEIRLGALRPHGNGRLAMTCSHIKYGDNLLVLDEETLALIGTEPQISRYPADLSRVESTFKGMQVRWSEDAGGANDSSTRYVLRWETLPQNRDHPRTGPLPEPSTLRLYELSAQ